MNRPGGVAVGATSRAGPVRGGLSRKGPASARLAYPSSRRRRRPSAGRTWTRTGPPSDRLGEWSSRSDPARIAAAFQSWAPESWRKSRSFRTRSETVRKDPRRLAVRARHPVVVLVGRPVLRLVDPSARCSGVLPSRGRVVRSRCSPGAPSSCPSLGRAPLRPFVPPVGGRSRGTTRWPSLAAAVRVARDR